MDIEVFDNIYSFTEYDARGNKLSTPIQMKKPNKDMYLFDIGDRNTLGIQVRSAIGSEHISITPAIVMDDLSYEEFNIDDESSSIVKFGRDTKYNAVILTNYFRWPRTRTQNFCSYVKPLF